MRRRLVMALLAFAPLALGGVAAADDDDKHRGDDRHEEHEEHEEHEHRRFLPFFAAPAEPRYARPPAPRYGPYRPSDDDDAYWRGRSDERARRYGYPPGYGQPPGYAEPPGDDQPSPPQDWDR